MVSPVENTRQADAVNWAQVRDRIDHGETGDKKAVEDPAVAPLGTAEAAGSSTRGEHVARSAAAEDAGSKARAVAQGRTVARPRRALVALAVALIAMAAVVLAVARALATLSARLARTVAGACGNRAETVPFLDAAAALTDALLPREEVGTLYRWR
jgi:hypothetical protein